MRSTRSCAGKNEYLADALADQVQRAAATGAGICLHSDLAVFARQMIRQAKTPIGPVGGRAPPPGIAPDSLLLRQIGRNIFATNLQLVRVQLF